MEYHVNNLPGDPDDLEELILWLDGEAFMDIENHRCDLCPGMIYIQLYAAWTDGDCLRCDRSMSIGA